MKRIPIPLVALAVVAMVFALLHFAGILVPRNPVAAEVDRDQDAADSAFNTVDIQQAMGLVTFEPPKMLNPPDEIPPLLLYPPSAADLEALSGK